MQKIITIKRSELSVAVINREAMILRIPEGQERYCIKSFMSNSPALIAELKRDISTEQGLRDLVDYLNKDAEGNDPIYRIIEG